MSEQAHTHALPLSIYFAIFAALLVLTGVTVAIAFVDLGPLNIIAALGIAGVKALLVALFFMHLRYSKRLTWLVAAGGFLWLSLLITFTLADVLTRGWLS
jgi:cytochrome c oxidase subunit 4